MPVPALAIWVKVCPSVDRSISKPAGVLVELLRDSALALAPIDEARAAALIGETRLGAMLAGYRGAQAGDTGALAALVAKISRIGAQYGDWLEAVDLNPVHVGAAGEGVRVLDALGVPFTDDELPQRIVGLKSGDPAAASGIRAAENVFGAGHDLSGGTGGKNGGGSKTFSEG